jgi:hypothetical protein
MLDLRDVHRAHENRRAAPHCGSGLRRLRSQQSVEECRGGVACEHIANFQRVQQARVELAARRFLRPERALQAVVF